MSAVPIKTALDARHRALGARMIPFAGWDMPVQYKGLVEEHNAVRTAAGLFDLSHMGEIFITGPDAAAALDYALVTAPGKLAVGRAHYSMICDANGGVIDDLIVYRLGDDALHGRAERVECADGRRRRWASDSPNFDAMLDDASMRTSLVAIQGPRAAEILQPFVDVDLKTIKYYSGTETTACGVPAILARTGYTGEDGFELFVAWDDAVRVWDTLLEAGAARGLVPAGLGARDTLRLEAGMPLYGQELDRDTTPFEAGLGRLVSFAKPGDFVGRAALERAKDNPRKTLVGLKLAGRGIARIGYPVYLPAAADAVRRRHERNRIADARIRDCDGLRARRSQRRLAASSKSAFAISARARKSCRCRSTNDRPEEAESHVDIPDNLKYSSEHEWLASNGKTAKVGITGYAAEHIGDIVFVELPKVGSAVTAGSSFGVIEAVKSVSELFAPVSGKVTAINERVAKEPELVTASPYDEGWLIEIEMSDDGETAALKDAAGYRELHRESSE